MEGLYIICGSAFIGLGIFILYSQVKRSHIKEQDEFGFDIKLLSGGTALIILGIAMIVYSF